MEQRTTQEKAEVAEAASVDTAGDWEVVIGLEVHIQVDTDSKQFTSCPNRHTRKLAEANKYTDPVSMGLPGTLPVLNRESVVRVLSLALALGCEPAEDVDAAHARWENGEIPGYIDRRSEFARKHYFYPDLPKGYQISQYDRPLVRGGKLDYFHRRGPDDYVRKTAELERVHLEEDTGKLFHLKSGIAAVDYNRAGVPLIELVTKPVFSSGEECVDFLETLRQTAAWLGISDAGMEKGNFRCEPNVSVRRAGEPLGVKREIKNLNSYGVLRRAVDYEREKQIEALEAGGEIQQATLRWDDNQTKEMRLKETEGDYRYFPEPDLPPLEITEDLLGAASERLGELPYHFVDRLVEDHGVRTEDAVTIRDSKLLREWFNELVAEGSTDAEEVTKWLVGEVNRLVKEKGAGEASASDLGEILDKLDAGDLRENQAKEVLAAVWEDGSAVNSVIEEKGFEALDDEGELEEICKAVVEDNPEIAEKIRKGKDSAIGALIGDVMQETKGSADPQKARELLKEAIEAGD